MIDFAGDGFAYQDPDERHSHPPVSSVFDRHPQTSLGVAHESFYQFKWRAYAHRDPEERPGHPSATLNSARNEGRWGRTVGPPEIDKANPIISILNDYILLHRKSFTSSGRYYAHVKIGFAWDEIPFQDPKGNKSVAKWSAVGYNPNAPGDLELRRGVFKGK